MVSVREALLDIIGRVYCLLFYSILIFIFSKSTLSSGHLSNDCFINDLSLSSGNVCRFDIEVSENIYFNETYKNCRVVLGFIILRQINLNWTPKVIFPNLEVIRDFLFVDHIFSTNNTNASNSLNLIFPRLESILGHVRLNNETLSISRYDASNHLGLDHVRQICGPIKIYNSPRVCFRHTATYWNWVSQFSDFRFDFPMNVIGKHEINIAETIEDGIYATLLSHYQIKESWRKKYNSFNPKMIYFIIYNIDKKYFQFLETGKKSIGCTDSSTFLFSDVIYTHYFDKRILNEFYNKSIKPSIKLKDVPHFDSLLQKPRDLLRVDGTNTSYERLFDILRLQRFTTPFKLLFKTELPENYFFKFDEYYIVKLEICFGIYHQQCEFSHISLFNPKKKEWKAEDNESTAPSSLDTGNQTLKYIIWMLAIVIGLAVALFICLRLNSFTRWVMNMKTYRQVQVITVNPGYSTIPCLLNSWSSDNQIELANNIFCEIDRSRIVHSYLIGDGEFGVVYEGLLLEDNPEDGNNKKGIKVAIKQLKKSSNPIEKERFIKEAQIMKSLESHFIVKLFGVCTLDDPILVVMEYMVNGDLKTFLRRKYEEFSQTNNIDALPNFDRIIQMAIQIADGMYFLHSHKVIHRDLAARNIMVNEDYVIKIGDFGLTRNLYQREYYRLREDAIMPVRWMAPESIRKLVFTYATDVWSYGVVLWEIMSFAEMPYVGEVNRVARQMIIDGIRLPKPPYCCPLLWNIARQCWRKNPNCRLTFKQIIDQLYVHLNVNRSPFDKYSYYATSMASSSLSYHKNLYQKFINLFASNRLNP